MIRRFFRLPSSPERMEEAVNDEIGFHLRSRAEQLEAMGHSPERAMEMARAEFGDVELARRDLVDVDRRVAARERTGRIVDALWSDARFGVRLLKRSPGFSIVATLSIAIGVGATTAVFGLVDSVLFHSLPYEPFDRIVMLWRQDLAAGQDRITLSTIDFAEYSTRARSFAAMGAARGVSFTARFGDEPVAVSGAEVTPSLFTALGIRPALGRGFGPADEDASSGRVAVVTYEFWQRTLLASPDAVGRDLVLRTGFNAGPDGTSIDGAYTIVGVLPRDARLPYRAADVWIPLRIAEQPAGLTNRGLIAFGQLRPGISLEQASGELAAITRDLAQRFPEQLRGQSSWLITLRAEDVGDITPTLVLVVVSVALLSLIVGTNLGNMLLSRLTERQREIAVRRAIGAGDRRIVGQLFVESGLLATAGATGGIVLAWWLTRILASTGPASVARIGQVQLNGRALVVAIVVAIVMSLIFGLVPAIRVARGSIGGLALRSDNAAPVGRLREVLIGVQVAMAFVVLVGAGLVVTSSASLGRADIGYDPRNVLTFQIAVPRDAYTAGPARTAFTMSLLERLRNAPGVVAAGAVSTLPQIDANPSIPFATDGSSAGSVAAGDQLTARFRTATPGYFAGMGIPLAAGRDFADGDQRRAVVISRAFRDRYFPNSDGAGNRVRLLVPGLDTLWLPVVGVVGDVRQWIEAEPEPTIYLMSMVQASFSVAVRTAAQPEQLAAAVQRMVREIDPNQPVFDVTTMEARLRRGQGLSFARFRTTLMGGLAFVALVLAALGIYGVVRYAVVSRTKEFGIRMALGASRREVVGMVLSRSLRPVTIGMAAGVGASLLGARAVASTLYGAAGVEAYVIAAIALLLGLLALAAAVEPAWKAGSVDPLIALRNG